MSDFWKQSNLLIQVKYQNNENQLEEGTTIFTENEIIGTEKINLFEGTISLNLDFRDRTDFPSYGTRFYAEYNNGFVTNLDYENYGKLMLLGEGYISFPSLLPLTLGLKAGGGKSFGKIPFYNQFTLGQNNFLKGYTNNRFTGTSKVFLQTGFRFNLLDLDGGPVPTKIGLVGFFNTGRVFQSGESSQKWHKGYGGGLFLVPIREEFTFFTVASFSEEESFLFEIGLGTAL
jgi:outer membrane protein assembly factor BamA